MSRRSPELNHRIMSAIKGKDTGIERRLRKALYEEGIRYRKNSSGVFGHPDISMKGLKIAIFCDSEFWHGKNFEIQKEKLSTNREYWIKKIERNIERDREVNEKLGQDGYLVIRFWGEEIEKDLESCVERVKAAVEERKTRLREAEAGKRS